MIDSPSDVMGAGPLGSALFLVMVEPSPVSPEFDIVRVWNNATKAFPYIPQTAGSIAARGRWVRFSGSEEMGIRRAVVDQIKEHYDPETDEGLTVWQEAREDFL